ncbi:phospholipase D family protein [Craurococcus roseus]|uniref:Phospholipase D n=1 Tax=Craurococcus roseus TaxID=77585 RepID=A0ABP3PTC2_9PROT
MDDPGVAARHGMAPAGAPESIPVLDAPGAAGVSLVPDNRAAFALRARSARAAAETLDLQYYTWNEDVTGALLAREVLGAADRGVRVRVLLDDLYVRGNERALMALAEHPSVEIRLYNPFRVRTWGTLGAAVDFLLASYRLNHRMHNKAWIADGRLFVGGGRNIGDEYFDAAKQFNFRDLDLVVEGVSAAEAVAQFDRYWHSVRARALEALAAAAAVRKRADKPGGLPGLRRRLEASAVGQEGAEYLAQSAAGPDLAALLADGRVLVPVDRVRIAADPPRKGLGRRRAPGMLAEVRAAIGAARREALIVSPYFVPGRRGAKLLAGLVRRGVRVVVVTNSLAATDVLAVHGGYARRRRRLLRAGVELRELKRGGQEGASLLGSGGNASLHTKAFCVDGELAFVGSFNFDPRSAHLNTEMGTFVRHPAVAERLRGEIERLSDPARSWVVRLDDAGLLVWEDGSAGGPVHGEPGTTLTRRVLARVLGWLPIEPYL